jgi:hypothetical protein
VFVLHCSCLQSLLLLLNDSVIVFLLNDCYWFQLLLCVVRCSWSQSLLLEPERIVRLKERVGFDVVCGGQ